MTNLQTNTISQKTIKKTTSKSNKLGEKIDYRTFFLISTIVVFCTCIVLYQSLQSPCSNIHVSFTSSLTEETPRPGYFPILTWQTAQSKVSWGVIILLGGGFALADAATVSAPSAARNWLSIRKCY